MRHQQIIEISFPKTGSRSLAQAFRVLGYSAAHGPINRLEEWDMRQKVAEGRADFVILDRYEFCGQLAPWWRQLVAERPQAGFVLLVRDINQWLISVQRHWRRPQSQRRLEWAKRGIYDLGALMRILLFGSVAFRPDEMAASHEAHVAEVRAAFAKQPDRLLVYDLCGGAGWAPLCEWLGVETPTSFDFPKIRMGTTNHASGYTIETAEAAADASAKAPGPVE